MSEPDGYEERTAFYQECYERDIDDLDIAEMMADEHKTTGELNGEEI
jgi:hypothetical protein